MNTLQNVRIDRVVPLRRIETTTATLVVTATLLVCSASGAAAALGNPELVAAVAALGVAVLLVGMGVLAVTGALDDGGVGRPTMAATPAGRPARFAGYEA